MDSSFTCRIVLTSCSKNWSLRLPKLLYWAGLLTKGMDRRYIGGLTSVVLNCNIVTGWKTFLVIATEMVGCTVVNMWAFFWLMPWFGILAGVLNVVNSFVIHDDFKQPERNRILQNG